MGSTATLATRRTRQTETVPPLTIVPDGAGKGSKRKRHLEVLARAAEDQMARTYAVCRSFGHSWVHHGPTGERSFGMVVVASTCSQCSMIRSRAVSRSGRTEPWSYKQPEQYHRSGDDQLSRQEWVRTWFVTTIGDE